MAARSWRCVSTMCSEATVVSSIPAPIELPATPSLVLPHARSTPLCLFTLTPPLTSPPLGYSTPLPPPVISTFTPSDTTNFLSIPNPEHGPRCTPHYSRTTSRHRRQRSRPNIPLSFFSASIPTPPIPAVTSPIETKPLGLNRGSAINLAFPFDGPRLALQPTAAAVQKSSDYFLSSITTLSSTQTGMLLSSNHGHHHHHHHHHHSHHHHPHHASMPYEQGRHSMELGATSSTTTQQQQSGASSAAASAPGSSSSPGSGRPRGHVASLSSDNIRPRSASSASTPSASRSGSSSSHVKIVPSQPSSENTHSTLTDEQRLSLLRQQQAQKRPKMLRLTPAVSSRSLSAAMSSVSLGTLPRREGESSRPASIIGLPSLNGQYGSTSSSSSSASASLSGSDLEPPPHAGLTIMIDPRTNGIQAAADTEDKVAFPMVGSPPSNHAVLLHPGSRKALAQKAGLQPAEGADLQLDLKCIAGPSVSTHSSTASVNSAMTFPELVRKKSGEPVKSSLKHFAQSAFLHRSDSSPAAPASFRAKSVPNTPTVAKAVHFDPVLEHIKVFKHRQRPTAVSRDGSPEHTETETEEERDFPFYPHWRKHAAALSSPSASKSPGSGSSTPSSETTAAAEQLVLRLPNFPSSAKLSVERNVFLERAFLSDDLRSVKGTIQVRNMAFEKWVAVRFTLDNWATACEVSAEYSESIKGGKSDRFSFSIKLNEMLLWTRGQQETKTMLLCLRYNTAGEEFWDNNEGANYQLDFRKRPIAHAEGEGHGPVAASPQPGQSADGASSGMARAATVSTPRKANSPGLGGSEFSSLPSRKSHKLMFEAEELGRTLAKLRAEDEEGEEGLPIGVRTLKTRRRSPPVSPGSGASSASGRSTSPSMWTARYDFDESLRNPKTGSRVTNAGRAAALDYFSAKPPPPASALQRSIFIGASANGSPMLTVGPSHDGGASSNGSSHGDVFSPAESVGSDTPVPTRRSSTTPVAVQLQSTKDGAASVVGTGGSLAVPMGMFTAKAGMISPGLGDVIAHLPTSISANSATPSPSTIAGSPASDATVSPSAVTEVGHDQAGSGTGSSGQTQGAGAQSHALVFTRSTPDNGRAGSMHTKYFSYPVHRHSLSPAAGSLHRISRGSEERAPSPLSRPALVMNDAHTASSGTASGRYSPTKKERNGEVMLSSSFVHDSPQHSPVSPLHSPNPFSPSLSVSSLESDNTTCLASPEDTVLTSGAGTNGAPVTPAAGRRNIVLRAPASIEDIHLSLLNMARAETSSLSASPSTLSSGVGPSSGSGSTHSHSQAGCGSPTLSAVSDTSSSSSSMKPNSVSSYDELIARFCFYDSSAEAEAVVAAAASSVPSLTTSSIESSTASLGSLSSGSGDGDGLEAVGDETLVLVTPTTLAAPVLAGMMSSSVRGGPGGAELPALPRDVHVPHVVFANAMGSPSTESGSTTPTIGF